MNEIMKKLNLLSFVMKGSLRSSLLVWGDFLEGFYCLFGS